MYIFYYYSLQKKINIKILSKKIPGKIGKVAASTGKENIFVNEAEFSGKGWGKGCGKEGAYTGKQIYAK